MDCRITDGARDLRAYLTAHDMSVPAFAAKSGLDRIRLQRVLLGERWANITVDFARAVEKATGGKIRWSRWLSHTARRPSAKAA